MAAFNHSVHVIGSIMLFYQGSSDLNAELVIHALSTEQDMRRMGADWVSVK